MDWRAQGTRIAPVESVLCLVVVRRVQHPTVRRQRGRRTQQVMNVVHIDIVQHQQSVLHQHNTDVLRDIMEEP